MEIKHNLDTERLLPETLAFDDHFLMADKALLSEKRPEIEFLKAVENTWKEIENFEFQKMDVDASFERLIKRI